MVAFGFTVWKAGDCLGACVAAQSESRLAGLWLGKCPSYLNLLYTIFRFQLEHSRKKGKNKSNGVDL